MCEYCDKSEGNKPLLDHGTCKAEIYHDGCDWMLSVTARQEDSWLAYEKPDSLDAIKVDLNSIVFDKDADELIGVRAGDLQDIVERLGKVGEWGDDEQG